MFTSWCPLTGHRVWLCELSCWRMLYRGKSTEQAGGFFIELSVLARLYSALWRLRVCSQLEHSRAAFCGGDWELMYLHTFVPSLVFEGTFYFSGVTRRWVTEPHSGYISEFIRTCFCKLLLVGKRPFLAPLGTRMGSGPYNLSPRR